MADNKVFELYYELKRIESNLVWERGKTIDRFFKDSSSASFVDDQGNPDYGKVAKEITESMAMYSVTTETESLCCAMMGEGEEPYIDWEEWEYCHQYYLKNPEKPEQERPCCRKST